MSWNRLDLVSDASWEALNKFVSLMSSVDLKMKYLKRIALVNADSEVTGHLIKAFIKNLDAVGGRRTENPTCVRDRNTKSLESVCFCVYKEEKHCKVD